MEMTLDFTQHHHWGVIEHGVRQLIHTNQFTDEVFWDFLSVEDILSGVLDLDTVNKFLQQGGGFELIDKPNPLPRFHSIELWAYHPDPRQLLLVSLQTKM